MVEIPSGNYRPGKYFKFGQNGNTGKYEILELFLLKYFVMFLYIKVDSTYLLSFNAYHFNKVINCRTGLCQRTQQMILVVSQLISKKTVF